MPIIWENFYLLSDSQKLSFVIKHFSNFADHTRVLHILSNVHNTQTYAVKMIIPNGTVSEKTALELISTWDQWKKCGVGLKYSLYDIEYAFENGHIESLNLWKEYMAIKN